MAAKDLLKMDNEEVTTEVNVFKEFIEKFTPAKDLTEATHTMSTAEIASQVGYDVMIIDALMRKKGFVLDNLGGSGKLEWLMVLKG